MRVEGRFRFCQRRRQRGVLADWRVWVVAHREGLGAVVKIQQAWFEHVRRSVYIRVSLTVPGPTRSLDVLLDYFSVSLPVVDSSCV